MFYKAVRHVVQCFKISSHCCCFTLEASTGNPWRDIFENGYSIYEEGAGLGCTSESLHGCLHDLHERIFGLIFSDVITEGKAKDKSTSRPREYCCSCEQFSGFRTNSLSNMNHEFIWLIENSKEQTCCALLLSIQKLRALGLSRSHELMKESPELAKARAVRARRIAQSTIPANPEEVHISQNAKCHRTMGPHNSPAMTAGGLSE